MHWNTQQILIRPRLGNIGFLRNRLGRKISDKTVLCQLEVGLGHAVKMTKPIVSGDDFSEENAGIRTSRSFTERFEGLLGRLQKSSPNDHSNTANDKSPA